jgi:hypothetical protein
MRRLLLLASLILAAAPRDVGAEVVAIPAVLDNTLFEDADGDTSDGVGPVLFAGKNGQGRVRRALIAFDVVHHVPAGSKIDSVVLTLQVSNAPNSILRQFTVHRVLKGWGEGQSSATGGGGAAAAAGDATWLNTFYPALPWTNRGGDFDPATSASLLVGEAGLYAWTGLGLTADVQSWLRQPGTDFGWLIQGEETDLNTARRFDSRENEVAAHRPLLTIFYSGLTASRVASWGSLKTRYR